MGWAKELWQEALEELISERLTELKRMKDITEEQAEFYFVSSPQGLNKITERMVDIQERRIARALSTRSS